jgi:3',5'-cyclic AMP phosphodiesterase CpdA
MSRYRLAAGLLLFLGCSRTPLEGLEPFPYEGTGGGASGGRASGGVSTGGRGGVSTGGVSTGGIATGGVSTGGAFGGASSGATAGMGASGGVAPPEMALVGAPMVFAPTAFGFSLSVVSATGDAAPLRAFARPVSGGDWSVDTTRDYPTADAVEFTFLGLTPGTVYEYRVILPVEGDDDLELATGRVTTQRPPGQDFTFALITDTHIPPRSYVPTGMDTENTFESTLAAVAQDIAAANPDFLMNLGDMLDFHMFGFNDPPPDSSWTRFGYLNYRRLFGSSLALAPHFVVIGNWDGENGCNGDEAIERSRSQRLLYVPGPKPDTYPEGGNDMEDYYAFTWGDALFVVLNVMTYTTGCHYLSYDPGVADDWTLGTEQMTWLRQTLSQATSKWRFVLIHHAVGGAAGDQANSAYGRGGGQAARVGEQAVVHDLMLQYGVQIFFYGHDHVFTDMVVDGIHYTLPGSAGAPWKFTTAETGYQTYWPDSGHALVHVSPASVRVDFLAQGGSLLTTYSIAE